MWMCSITQGHSYTSCLFALLSELPQPGEEGRSSAPACSCRRTKQQPAHPGSRHSAGLTHGVFTSAFWECRV